MISKAERVIDARYLRWCRAQPCAFCQRPPQSQAHHVFHKGMGGATKRDDYAVPACNACHMMCHRLRVVTEHEETPSTISMEWQMKEAEEHRARYVRGERASTGLIPF